MTYLEEEKKGMILYLDFEHQESRPKKS